MKIRLKPEALRDLVDAYQSKPKNVEFWSGVMEAQHLSDLKSYRIDYGPECESQGYFYLDARNCVEVTTAPSNPPTRTSTWKLHWCLVLNTQHKTKASRILKPFEPYSNLIVEKFLDPDCTGIKAYFDVALTMEFPGVVAEALQTTASVGPSLVYMDPTGMQPEVEGTIEKPKTIGVTFAGWSLVEVI